MREGLVLCARSNPKHGDPFAIPPGSDVNHRTCVYCAEDLLVSNSTVALEETWKVIYACNPCGKKSVAARGANQLGIAPGAFAGGTPGERRRRNELEAHGFRDLQ